MSDPRPLPPMPACITLQTRRAFLHKAGLVAVAGTLGLGLAGCSADAVGPGDEEIPPGAITVNGSLVSIDLTGVPELNAANGFLYITQAGGRAVNVIVVNLDGATFRAFTSICTHEGNPVRIYRAGAQQFECPTHGSRFNLDGVRVSGPAPTGSRLTQYAVSRTDNTLVVDKSASVDALA